jgi:hypothetical protein
MSACDHCDKVLRWHGETCNCEEDYTDHAKPPERCDCTPMATWLRDVPKRQFQCIECGKVVWFMSGKWQSCKGTLEN